MPKFSKYKLVKLKLLASLFFVLVACGPSFATPQSVMQIWIDAPLDGSTIPLLPYNVIFSGSASPNSVDYFDLWINGLQVASLLPHYQSEGSFTTYVYSEYLWLPPAPGTYRLSVRGVGNGEIGPFVESLVIVQNGDAEVVVGEQALEPPPTSTPTPAPDELLAVAIRDSNCRYGCQASQFEIADTLLESFQYPINAFSSDGFFAQFIGPVTGQRCWVPLSLLDLQLNGVSTELQDLPVELVNFISCPPTPEPPTATNAPVQPTDTPVPSAPKLECDDGIDNDGDGFIDLADPQCRSASDNDELNP